GLQTLTSKVSKSMYMSILIRGRSFYCRQVMTNGCDALQPEVNMIKMSYSGDWHRLKPNWSMRWRAGISILSSTQTWIRQLRTSGDLLKIVKPPAMMMSGSSMPGTYLANSSKNYLPEPWRAY